jgi:hypothetical protein
MMLGALDALDALDALAVFAFGRQSHACRQARRHIVFRTNGNTFGSDSRMLCQSFY